MQNPSFRPDSDGEYFEIFNRTDQPLDLFGVVVRDDDLDRYQIHRSLVLPAQSYVVLARNGDDALNGNLGAVLQFENFFLANGNDEVVLETWQGFTIDRVAYDNGSTFPDPSGASMQFVGRIGIDDNNDGRFWCESQAPLALGDRGTPGERNGDCGVVSQGGL